MELDLGPLDEIPPREFLTERLRLRAVRPGDGRLLFDLYASDPEATRYMSFKCTGNVADTESVIEPAAKRFAGETSSATDFIWVIESRTTGEPLGSLGYGPVNAHTLGGGYILNRQHWGKGYASEAWSCIVEWAQSQPRVFRIEAVHDVDNPSSGRVMEKAGMKLEGVLRRHSISPNVSDEPRDAVMYAWARP
jgi:RimJ/RimL family protein N-acetyltransferase